MLHLLLRAEHHISNALPEVCLWVSDESDVFNGTTVSELRSELLLANDKGQVSYKDASGEVFPRVNASVAATS